MLLEKVICICLIVISGLSVVLIDIAVHRGHIQPDSVTGKVLFVVDLLLCVMYFVCLYWLSVLFE